MSSIGATTGKEPDFVEDGDLKSVAELRGAYKDMHKAKLSLNERASVAGCMAEVEVIKQRIDMVHEQLRRMIGMYQTLQAEFDEHKAARVRELGLRMNGGSTTPEDYDNGSDTRPSN